MVKSSRTTKYLHRFINISRTAKILPKYIFKAERLKFEREMKITDTASFGKALRERRKTLGYTQQYISDFTGFSVSFISDLERGKETAELGKAIYLANLLGLDVDITLRGST